MDKNSKESTPIFNEPISVNFEKYNSDEVCTLVSLDQVRDLSNSDMETIIEICNQPLIYNFLFYNRLKGRKYSNADADRFTMWAKEGWKNKTHFVFLIKSEKDGIVACCDIKSPDLDSAEIGYWASNRSSGVMTNAINLLCDIAHKAGYKSIFGLVDPTNTKSLGVLSRNNFQNTGIVTEEGKEYLKFIKGLQFDID